MAKKRFHYLIAQRDDIHPGDVSGRLRKWKIAGTETIADTVSFLLADFIPNNRAGRTET